MGSKEKTIRSNYLFSLIRTGCGLVVPLIIFAYVARILSSDGIGKVDFSRSIVSYFTYFATLGVSTYGVREAAKVRDDVEKLSKVVEEIFIINLASTIIAYVAFGLSIVFVPQFEAYSLLLMICGLSIGATSLGIEWLYSAIEEFKYITIRSVVFQVISLVAVFLLVTEYEDYYIYAIILTFSSVGANVFNFFHARKYLNIRIRRKRDIKKHIRPILIFFSTAIAGNIYQTLDISMVGLMSTDTDVGLYSASVKMNRVLVGVITVLPMVLLPRLSYYLEKGDVQRYKNLLKQGFDCIIGMSLPLATMLLFMSDEILVIFSGQDFLGASSSTKLLASIVVLIPISTFTVNQILIPYGKEKHQFISTLFGAGTDLIFNLIFIPMLGHFGAAIGTVVAAGVVATFTMYMSTKCLDIKYLFKGIWKYLVGALVLGGVVIICRIVFNGVALYITTVVFGFAVYLITLYVLKDSLLKMIINSLWKIVKR